LFLHFYLCGPASANIAYNHTVEIYFIESVLVALEHLSFFLQIPLYADCSYCQNIRTCKQKRAVILKFRLLLFYFIDLQIYLLI
jgi:hypothetical protein